MTTTNTSGTHAPGLSPVPETKLTDFAGRNKLSDAAKAELVGLVKGAVNERVTELDDIRIGRTLGAAIAVL